jgi:hypothetical protein
MLVFFLGTLLGILLGGALCAAYFRQEITAGVSPKLRNVELHLDYIESQLSLALLVRNAELPASAPATASRPIPGAITTNP